MRSPALFAALALAACGAATPEPEAAELDGPPPWETAAEACERGDDVYACYDAAGWYSGEPTQYPHPDEEGPPQDMVRMVELLEHACELHDRDACEWMLAVVLVQPELEASAHVSERLGAACQRGDALSCVIGGVVLEGSDREAAQRAYLAGCDGGSQEGCYRAAVLELDESPELARALFARGCTQERQWGCMEYGRVLAEGVGGDPDPAHARTVFGWVCDLEQAKASARGEEGEPESCATLASLP